MDAKELQIVALKDALDVRNEMVERLQNSLIYKQEDLEKAINTNFKLMEKSLKYEALLLEHQNLTQWIEEEMGSEIEGQPSEPSHDFLQILLNKVEKINK